MSNRPEAEKPVEDILFLACTRPTMIAGVTAEAFPFILFLSCLIFLIGGHLLYLLSGLFIYLACRSICAHDPNQFALLRAWSGTKAACKTKLYWGASSTSPLRIRKARSWRDLAKEN